MKNNKNDDLEMWASYISENKKNIISTILSNLKSLRFPIDESTMSVIVNEFEAVGSVDSFWLLRFIVEPGEFVKMRARFRGYKYRRNGNYTKIGISSSTFNKLMAIKKEHDFDTFDDVLDYVLTELKGDGPLPIDEEVDISADIGNSITIEKSLERLIAQLEGSNPSTLINTLEQIYHDAWRTAKASRSRKANKINDEWISTH